MKLLLEFHNGSTQEIDGVRRVSTVTFEEPASPKHTWTDCPLAPADTHAILAHILNRGYCDVRLFSAGGEIRRATVYVPGDDERDRRQDDLVFEDGALLSTLYAARYPKLPSDRTIVEYSVYGFGVRK